MILENIVIILKDFIEDIGEFYKVNTTIYNKKIMIYSLNHKYSYLYVTDTPYRDYIRSLVNSYNQINLNLTNVDDIYIKCDVNELIISNSSNIKIRSLNINRITIYTCDINNITVDKCNSLYIKDSKYKRNKFNIDKVYELYLDSNELANNFYINNVCILDIQKCTDLENINILNTGEITILNNDDLIDCTIDNNIINICTDFTLMLSNYKQIKNLKLCDNIFNTSISLNALEYLSIINCINIDTINCNNLEYFHCENNEKLTLIKSDKMKILKLIYTNIDTIECINLNKLDLRYNDNIYTIDNDNIEYLILCEIEYLENIYCKNLQSIHLYRCPLINTIEFEFVTELIVEECLITNIICPNLATANINNCHLLENIIGNRLKLLDIKNSSIKNIECNELHQLIIDNCNIITDLNHKSLTMLTISNMDALKKINCKNLKKLDISNINIDNINITYNNSITELILNKVNIDKSNIEYNNLKKLKVTNSNIKILPKYYKNLLCLALIDIDNIKNIELPVLDTLRLTNCYNIKSILCPNLKILNIDYNVSLKILCNMRKLNNIVLTNCIALEDLDVSKQLLNTCIITGCCKLVNW